MEEASRKYMEIWLKEDDKNTTFFHKMVNATMEGIF